MAGSVVVLQSVLRAIERHARQDAPNECCGLLVGQSGLILASWRARNVDASPTRYSIDPADHFAALAAARDAGLEVVGAYHSHPHSVPVPSATDLAEPHDSTYLYLIAGIESDRWRVRAFWLDERASEVRLVPRGWTARIAAARLALLMARGHRRLRRAIRRLSGPRPSRNWMGRAARDAPGRWPSRR